METELMIRQMGKKVFAFVVDVASEKQVELAANQVRCKIGDVDILINNAGIAPCEPFKKLSYDRIKQVFEVNILAHFWASIRQSVIIGN